MVLNLQVVRRLQLGGPPPAEPHRPDHAQDRARPGHLKLRRVPQRAGARAAG